MCHIHWFRRGEEGYEKTRERFFRGVDWLVFGTEGMFIIQFFPHPMKTHPGGETEQDGRGKGRGARTKRGGGEIGGTAEQRGGGGRDSIAQDVSTGGPTLEGNRLYLWECGQNPRHAKHTIRSCVARHPSTYEIQPRQASTYWRVRTQPRTEKQRSTIAKAYEARPRTSPARSAPLPARCGAWCGRSTPAPTLPTPEATSSNRS